MKRTEETRILDIKVEPQAKMHRRILHTLRLGFGFCCASVTTNMSFIWENGVLETREACAMILHTFRLGFGFCWASVTTNMSFMRERSTWDAEGVRYDYIFCALVINIILLIFLISRTVVLYTSWFYRYLVLCAPSVLKHFWIFIRLHVQF